MNELVRGITVTPRVLIIGARPSDADADLIAWLARGHMVQTGFLALSRGESATNHAGIESGVALGAIHVEEALAARRVDGGEQFFTRAYEPGPARNADEVFKRWDRDSLLGNLVTIVRSFRPHVLVSRFTADSSHDGQQQAAALLAREVFEAALDTVRFKRATFGTPWSVTSLFEPGPGVVIDAHEYDRARGQSYAEMGAESRAQLRTMGFETPPRRDSGHVSLRLVVSHSAVAAPASIFDGVDTTFARFKAAAPASVNAMLPAFLAQADSARQAVAFGVTPRLVGYLARTAEMAAMMRNSSPSCKHPARDATNTVGPRRQCEAKVMDLDASMDLVQARANEALLIASGVSFEAVADREFLSNRDTALVTITARNDGDAAFTLNDVTLAGAVSVRMTEPVVLPPHSQAAVTRQLVHLADAHPWWLWQRKQNFYPDVTTPIDGVPHADLMPQEWGVSGIAVPENIRRLSDVTATVTLSGATITTSVASVIFRDADPMAGVRNQVVSGVPAVTLAFERALEWAQAGKPVKKQLRLVMRSFAGRPVQLTLKATAASPTLRFDSLPGKVEIAAHQSSELRIPLKGTVPQGRYELSVTGASPPDDFSAGFKTAQYPHLPPIHLYRNSTVNLQAVDIEIPPRLNVAYVRGVGEDTDVALKQLGIPAYVFNDEGLLRFDLADFSTIVIGPGAYETNRGLYMQGPRFTEFVRKGGTLVVLANPAAAAQPGVLPVCVSFGPGAPERVNAEDAPVRALDQRARLLGWPNAIRDNDWANWVGARAAALPLAADARWTPLVEMHDAGQPENRNAILVATLGKGRYVYSSITFPQQIANGVTGAMRLFVNLLSAGLSAEGRVADASP